MSDPIIKLDDLESPKTGIITLLDGRSVDPTKVFFDHATYHFTLNGEDLTNLISRGNKIKYWSNFDVAVDNDRLSRGGAAPGKPLDTNVWRLFMQNVEASTKPKVNTTLIVAGVVLALLIWNTLTPRR